MATIPSNGTFTGVGTSLVSSRRIPLSDTSDAKVIIKVVQPTAEQKADLAQRQADAAARAVDVAKREQEVEKNKHIESHEMYLPNISGLSLENAKKSVADVQLMIRNHEDAGVNVHGRYGDQKISNLSTYLTGLKDFISKHDTTASSLSNETAASVYRQVQDMENAGTK
jgi:hypothetical protein